MIGEHDVVTVLGMRGCGKSTLTRALASIFPRKIIFDRMNEWGHIPFVTGVTEFKYWYEKNNGLPNYEIAVRFPRGISVDDLALYADEILRVVYECELLKGERGLPYGTCIVLEELQFYCTPHSILPYLFECLHTGRHAGIALMGNTQRPAAIHKSFISQSQHLYLGRIFEQRDVEYLRNSAFGDSAFQASALNPGEFLYVAPGQSVMKIPSVFF